VAVMAVAAAVLGVLVAVIDVDAVVVLVVSHGRWPGR
jgi:hypothetical protein